MPNHVTTKIHANKDVLNSMINQGGCVDFDTVIPYPEGMKDTEGMGIYMDSEKAAELVCGKPLDENPLIAALEARGRSSVNALEMCEESFEQFIVMVTNKKKTGYYHKMDFNREVWGTKWNAYDQDVSKLEDGVISFDTAWSHPIDVLKALSLKFPSEEIKVEYADEDTGSNCGYYTIANGELIVYCVAPKWGDMTSEEKSKWTEFAFTLRYPNEDPKEYGYDENWQHIED